MGALTHNGEVMQGLPADASQINFDKTGTDLNSTQTENAIKEVNTKVNTNAADIDQLKSGLTVQTLNPVFNTDAVTGAHVHAYRVGQMVFVDVEYEPVGGTLVTNTAVLSLLPPPLSEFWSVYDGYTTLKVDPDGILKYWYPADSTTLTRRDYSFSYIAA